MCESESRREYQLCSCSPTEEAIALEAMRWRFESSQEYQHRDVIQWTEALVWDQGVAGSNPVIPTILSSRIFIGLLAERICSRLLSGIIQVQPLGNPPNRTPVTQLAEVPSLNLGSCWFKSSQGYAGMEQQWLGRFIPYTSASAILALVTKIRECRLME
jgi:hypothetical protein